MVLLSDRATGRGGGPPGHLPRLDGAARPAPGPHPLGGAGGLSAGRGRGPADPRAAGVRGAVEGGPAADGPAHEVRGDLRAGPGQHAVGRALPRRQGPHQRSLRHHERRVSRAGRRRVSPHPGRGAAAPRAHDPARLHRRRSGIPDRGLQSPARRGGRRDLGAHLLGQSQPAARVLGDAQLRARAALSPPARRRRDHLRVRQHRRPRSPAVRQAPDGQEDRDRRDQPLQHGGRAARVRGRPDPEGAPVHSARAAGRSPPTVASGARG